MLRTNRDRVVDPASQTEFITSIGGARLVEHDDGHIVCAARETFAVPMLTRACVCRVAGERLNEAEVVE